MNTVKSNSPIRLIAFFLVALILVCTFGFTADGWNIKDEKEEAKGDDNAAGGETAGGEENEDGNEDGDDVPTFVPETYIPEFVGALTGLECAEELAHKRPTAFVMNSSSPIYGATGSELLVELPVEDGTTRLLSFTTDVSALWKIGSLTATRDYISNVANFFSSTLVAVGCDDKVSYEHTDTSSQIFDLTVYSGYHYTEYTHYNYSNGDLISAGLQNAGIGSTVTQVSLPFVFSDFGSEPIKSVDLAYNISIPYSSISKTELVYSEEDELYKFSKNGTQSGQLVGDNAIKFKNCFVLFADSVTYEGADGIQMVMNTIGEGTGLYFTEGSVTAISWKASVGGKLTFLKSDGSTLTVNRGTSYIAYVKSSKTSDITYS